MSDDILVDMLDNLEKKIGRKFERLDELESTVTGLSDSMTTIQQKGFGAGLLSAQSRKTFGREVIEAEQFKQIVSKQAKHVRIETKNTILGEAGSPQNPVDTIAPYDVHRGIVGGAFRRLSLLDVIPRGVTSSNQVHYTKEASWTNAAAETAEAGQKPEATLTFTDVDEPVRTVAHFLKVSRQVMDDAPALGSYIDQRMSHGVRQRLEAQIIAGDGSSPNLSGMTTTGNHTDLTVVTADNDFEAANRAKTQILSADYEPSFFVINPADWGRMERLRTGISGDATPLGGQGNVVSYLAGGLQPMLWGMPVVTSTAMTAGSFICAARDSLMLWERQSTAVEIFEQNQDDVEKNLLTIRAEGRWAFTVFRPAAVIVGAWPDA